MIDSELKAERDCCKKELILNKIWLNGQKEAFQAAMKGSPLNVSLKALIDIITDTYKDARAGFYLEPSKDAGLHHVVGMSDSYAADVSGLKIGSDSVACGLAMYKEKPVITKNVETDPAWKPWLYLARKHDYRACWSFPVQTGKGPALGTLALYFSYPREPVKRDVELIAILTYAASIIISRDRELKDRAAAEEALRQSEIKLKKLVRLRDEFIGNASHELNTPLTSMMIYSEFLMHYFKDIANPKQTEILKKMSQQVDRLHLLIQIMLDTTSLAEGELQLSFSHFNLNQLIQEKVEDLMQMTTYHQFVLDLQPGTTILADDERIGQVLTNLLSNAIKYSPSGGEIRISSFTNNDRITVRITDPGIGIPVDACEEIFERFYRVQTPETSTFPGMGIGLSICKNIIDLHEGCIKATSELGKSSTFEFSLPIERTITS